MDGVQMSSTNLCDEFVGCDFGDVRLSKRILNMANNFEGNPQRSIPSTFKTRNEWEACYRFFDNESVTPDAIIEPHIQATRQRIRDYDVVVLAQDTTELDLTRPHQQVEGAGPMDHESRRGAFFHPTMAFTNDGVPLGFVSQQSWTRDKISKESEQEKSTKRKAAPIEEKESYRWLIALQAANETAKDCPETTCICTGDSESDIYELYALAHKLRGDQANLHLLVRAGQNRNTTEDSYLKDLVRKAPLLAIQNISIRAREAKNSKGDSPRNRPREARNADVEIRALRVEVERPKNVPSTLPKALALSVVLVEEVNPPEGEDAICWMLVTTLPIDTEEQIHAIIHYYCVRWQIEVYFRTLKSGCRIEYRRFEHIDRVKNCLALFSIVAWRIMYICHLGRECPDMDCEAIFEPSEWKSVFAVLKKEIPTTGCPKLQEVVRAIAQLGGFVNRPKNQPGTQTLWLGMQRCYDMSTAWIAFGPDSKKISTS